MIKIIKLTFNPFAENTFILYDESNECIIIDPGCYFNEEEIRLVDNIRMLNLKPVGIYTTHSHIDHVLGNNFIKNYYNIPLNIYKDDIDTLKRVDEYYIQYGFHDYKKSPNPDILLNENDIIKFGNSELRIMHLPGHSPGHIAYISDNDKFVINGDCLFQGSIGRTDLTGGNHDQLLNSIKNKLFTLKDEYTVYCGHGNETNIGIEKLNNPFLV